MSEILERAAFEAWLKDHWHEEVGCAGWPQSCPIARYLQEKLGVGVRACATSISVDREGVEAGWLDYPVPGWARSFIRAVDTYYVGTRLTGQQAYNELPPAE